MNIGDLSILGELMEAKKQLFFPGTMGHNAVAPRKGGISFLSLQCLRFFSWLFSKAHLTVYMSPVSHSFPAQEQSKNTRIFQVSSKPCSSFRHLRRTDRSSGDEQALLWYCYINIQAFSKVPPLWNMSDSWAASKLSNTGEVLREQTMHCSYTFFSLLLSKRFTDIPELGATTFLWGKHSTNVLALQLLTRKLKIKGSLWQTSC